MMKRAFVNTEFYTVLSLIAVVVAVLIPFIGRARENSRRTSCQSHLKQIGLATQQYLQDSDGYFPSNQISPAHSWSDSIQVYVRDWSVFQCPNGKRPSGVNIRLTDYFANTRLFKMKSKEVVFPSSTIMVGDGVLDAPPNFGLEALPDGWRDYDQSPAYRHIGGANHLFVDGHVKWMKPDKVTLQAPKKAGSYTFSPR